MSAKPSTKKVAKKASAETDSFLPPYPLPSERGLEFRPDDLERIRPHVIDLRAGRFIKNDQFSTEPVDVDKIFIEHLPKSKKKKVIIWAHGGLVSQSAALQHVLDHLGGWEDAGIYPIYFVWHTDIWTSVKDIFTGGPKMTDRGLGDWLVDKSDALLETSLHFPAVGVWSKIKDYARLASENGAGAYYAAQKLAAFAKQNPDIEFYACGHSAGSIFHGWFLPVAIGMGVAFKELFLLAPAITVPDFDSHLHPLVGPGKGIDKVTLFTMNESAELADNCAKIYRKSLLYFVSRSCEQTQPTPILGLQESLRSFPALKKLFGIGTSSSTGEVTWSPNGRTDGFSASNSTSHGGFDNDFTTLNSIARRITGKSSLDVFQPETERDFAVPEVGGNAFRGQRPPRRRAVCIGIDNYPGAQLYGCVNDAKEWEFVLKTAGFDTSLLTNEQASRNGLIRAFDDLIDGSQAGDVLVFQYSGHGTHVDDVDGDEIDGQDEALVPIDYEDGQFLIDDDIADLLNRVPAGVNFTCFMDCCHSSENTRFLAIRNPKQPGELSRYLPVPPAIMQQHVLNRKVAPPRAVRSPYAGKPEVNFTACRSDQTAKENNGHGYFTTVATQILRGKIDGLTHQEFLKRVRAKFPLPASSQEPQFNADDSRLKAVLFQAPGGSTPAQVRSKEQLLQSLPSGDLDEGATEVRMLIETMRDAMHVLRKLIG